MGALFAGVFEIKLCNKVAQGTASLVQDAVVDEHANDVGGLPLASDLPQRLVSDMSIDANARELRARGTRIGNTSGTIDNLHKTESF